MNAIGKVIAGCTQDVYELSVRLDMLCQGPSKYIVMDWGLSM